MHRLFQIFIVAGVWHIGCSDADVDVDVDVAQEVDGSAHRYGSGGAISDACAYLYSEHPARGDRTLEAVTEVHDGLFEFQDVTTDSSVLTVTVGECDLESSIFCADEGALYPTNFSASDPTTFFVLDCAFVETIHAEVGRISSAANDQDLLSSGFLFASVYDSDSAQAEGVSVDCPAPCDVYYWDGTPEDGVFLSNGVRNTATSISGHSRVVIPRAPFGDYSMSDETHEWPVFWSGAHAGEARSETIAAEGLK